MCLLPIGNTDCKATKIEEAINTSMLGSGGDWPNINIVSKNMRVSLVSRRDFQGKVFIFG
jgi:hypothetical protein